MPPSGSANARGTSRLKPRPPRSTLLRVESARIVQQPVNPGVLESARQLIDRTSLRWPEAVQLGSALTARDMFPGTLITFVSASPTLLEAARADGFEVLDPGKLPAAETNAA